MGSRDQLPEWSTASWSCGTHTSIPQKIITILLINLRLHPPGPKPKVPGAHLSQVLPTTFGRHSHWPPLGSQTELNEPWGSHSQAAGERDTRTSDTEQLLPPKEMNAIRHTGSELACPFPWALPDPLIPGHIQNFHLIQSHPCDKQEGTTGGWIGRYKQFFYEECHLGFLPLPLKLK